MYRKGSYVAKHIEPVDEEQIQPHGVDLTAKTFYDFTEASKINQEKYDIGKRSKVKPDEDGLISLYGGFSYLFDYEEKIKIPDGHVGVVRPRSRLMRCGCNLVSAAWDAGYEGVGKGMIMCGNSLYIKEGSRIAQMQFIKAESSEELYDGTHQGEGL